jgi:hypothetical protein
MKKYENSTMADLVQFNCGDIDISILADGRWFHEGGPITRISLVKLFAGILERDEEGCYWLVTPVERARIVVEDAPFVAVKMEIEGEGQSQVLSITTNLDDTVRVDSEHPLVFRNRPNGEVAPYVLIRKDLEALAVRSIWYQLVDLFKEEKHKNESLLGVWSSGIFFPYDSTKGILSA